MVGLTDTGKVRQHNEDYIAYNNEQGFALLADGMGAHAAGEIASELAVQTAQAILTATVGANPQERLETAVKAAHNSVYEKAQTSLRYQGMGTTLVATLLDQDQLYHAHVGDSRLYRLRGGQLEALTRDHSLLQEFIDQGVYTPEEARQKVARNILTRALGLEADLKADCGRCTVREGDRFLLCTDGLYEMLSNDEIAAIMLKETNIQAMAGNLIELANIRGGKDNLSVIVIDVRR